jgi:hypothetical protein
MDYETKGECGETDTAALIVELLKLPLSERETITEALIEARRRRSAYPADSKVVEYQIYDPSGSSQDEAAGVAFIDKNGDESRVTTALDVLARDIEADLGIEH